MRKKKKVERSSHKLWSTWFHWHLIISITYDGAIHINRSNSEPQAHTYAKKEDKDIPQIVAWKTTYNGVRWLSFQNTAYFQCVLLQRLLRYCFRPLVPITSEDFTKKAKQKHRERRKKKKTKSKWNDHTLSTTIWISTRLLNP